MGKALLLACWDHAIPSWAQVRGSQCKLSALSAVLSLPLEDQHTGRAWGNGFGLQEFVFQELDWKTCLGKSNTSTMFEPRHFNRENRAFYKNILVNLLDTIWGSRKYQSENKHIFHMLTVSSFDSVSFKLEAECGEHRAFDQYHCSSSPLEIRNMEHLISCDFFRGSELWSNTATWLAHSWQGY